MRYRSGHCRTAASRLVALCLLTLVPGAGAVALLAPRGDSGLPNISFEDDGPQAPAQTCPANQDQAILARISRSQVLECVADQKLVFLHIPKNAGSAVEEAGIVAGIRWGKHMDFVGCDLGANDCSVGWHQPPALLYGINMYTQSTVFCVVRDPIHRAISEYRYIVANPQYQWQYKHLVKKWGCHPNGLNGFLRSAMDRYLGGEPFLQLCHMLPQYKYIWGPPDENGTHCQWCSEVLRLDDFPQSFNSLMDRYGYTGVRLPPRDGSGPHDEHDNSANVGACQELGPDDVETDVRVKLVTVYEQDFRMMQMENPGQEFPGRGDAWGVRAVRAARLEIQENTDALELDKEFYHDVEDLRRLCLYDRRCVGFLFSSVRNEWRPRQARAPGAATAPKLARDGRAVDTVPVEATETSLWQWHYVVGRLAKHAT